MRIEDSVRQPALTLSSDHTKERQVEKAPDPSQGVFSRQLMNLATQSSTGLARISSRVPV